MDEQDPDTATAPLIKPKRMPPSRKGQRPANAWPKGVSGNPRGRVKHTLAFAERVRERVDPDLVIELALRVANDEKLEPTARLAALWPLVDRGWTKPPAHILATLETSVASDYSHLTEEQIEQMLAMLQPNAGTALVDQGSSTTMVTVEDVQYVHLLSTTTSER